MMSSIKEYFKGNKSSESSTSKQAKSTAEMTADTLAKVGNWTITADEFKERLNALKEVVPTSIHANIESIILGGLIVLFLIVEPYGMARLWHTIKDKMRLWPFPY